MKKSIIFNVLFYSLAGTVHAQSAQVPGDIVSPGSNAWTLHTPDDGRTDLFLAPWVNGGWRWDTQTKFSSNGDVRFSGKVGIGQKTTIGVHSDSKLSVYGKVTANSLYVLADNSTNWADYVFADKYQLMPLPELEAYVQKNRHLPEIPTTCDVETNGINVAAMNTLLLKKVEELTLHLIELNKEVQQLKAEKTNTTK